MATAKICVEWQGYIVQANVDLPEMYGEGRRLVAGGPLAALTEAVERATAAIGAQQ